MNEILLRRRFALFNNLIDDDMEKIVDVTLTAENYSSYTNVVYKQNSIYINKDNDGNSLMLDKECVIRIDVAKDSQWTSSSKPSFFLYDKATVSADEVLRNMVPDVSSGATKSVMFVHIDFLGDCYIYTGAFFGNQYQMADSPSKLQNGFQDKAFIDGIRLSFGTTWTPTIGTRVRIYSK